MKAIDFKISEVWPSWYYSDNLRHNVLKECFQPDKDYCLSISAKKANRDQRIESVDSLATIATTEEKKMLSERSLLLSGYSNKNTIDGVKANSKKNNTPQLAVVASAVQETGVTLTPTTTAAAAAAYLYLEKVKNERMSPHVTAAQLDSLKDAIMESSAAAAVAAAMVNNNNVHIKSNSISNNNNIGNNNNYNNNNNTVNTLSETSNNTARNDSNSNSIQNNNLVNSQTKNSIANSAVHNTSDDLQSHSLTQSSNHTQQQHQNLKQPLHHHSSSQSQQQQQQSLHMNNNNVKKERLSPGSNGDLLSSLSRSRSTTPSSFRGTSPQQSIHSSPSETLVPMHNLSTNLLNSIHHAASASSNRNTILGVSASGINNANSSLPTDFSTRNYSDIMRSLAAKYNNTNTNDNLKRNNIFETTANSATPKKTPSTAQKTSSYASSTTTPINKEVSITTTSSLPPPQPITTAAISPGETTIKLTPQNKLAAAVANAAVACSSNVSPYMTSFLSSLPFSPGIFPPLIDMSSTQALIILARAAKENEIHNILNASALNQKTPSGCISLPPSPNLNIALQQAAQFISPALIYSSQLQKQQLQHQQQISRQSSPRLANITNSTSSCISAKTSRNQTEKINISPLDLSSQPPAVKRFKAESTSSQSSAEGLANATLARSSSSSTATTSPSPPPFNEKLSSAATTTDNAVTPISVEIGLSTKAEATTTAAFTPIKAASTTSGATSSTSIAPALSIRQCQAHSEELNSWTVDDVCAFVGSIDICAEYVTNFREQCIDGSGLPLLTEDHLVNSLGMKLGPALKLRSLLAKKLGGPCPCVSCVTQVQQVLALQTSNMTTTPTPIFAATPIDNPVSGTTIIVSATESKSNLQKNALKANFDMNYNCQNTTNSNNNRNINLAYQDGYTKTSSANSILTKTTTDFCRNVDNSIRSGGNNIRNSLSSTSPPPQPEQQQQHHNNNKEVSPSDNICNSSSSNISSDNNDNLRTNRHDNVDSSSCS